MFFEFFRQLLKFLLVLYAMEICYNREIKKAPN